MVDKRKNATVPSNPSHLSDKQSVHRTNSPEPSYWDADLVVDAAVPVAKPRLPPASEILPYLQRIDQTRRYSNGGPLVRELETRLASTAGHDARAVTVANATIGLTLSLQAQGVAPGTLCMMPAWTFAATAHAAILAGLVPWFVDVSPTTWAMEPNYARDVLRDAPGVVSAVIPVSPFGQPIDPGAWEAFHDDLGLAVVIDAAASFDTVRASILPSVVSLHATKVLGIGEGGYVVSTDTALIQSVRQRAQFGFWTTRESLVPALNAKISEYSAAVGMAALDAWPVSRADYHRVAAGYRGAFAGKNDIILQDGFGEGWVASTVVVAVLRLGAEAASRRLAAHRIGSRRWWGGGLHRHSAFMTYPRHDTLNTDALVEGVIGLPCWPDLPDEEIARIAKIIDEQ